MVIYDVIYELIIGNDDETYGAIYEVMHRKFRASLEPLRAVKFARNIV